jgi:YVTN family beta-propeller protein
MKIITCLSVLSLVLLSACFRGQKQSEGGIRIGPQADGSVLVPSNQLLRPAGLQVYLPGRPVDMTLTADGKYLLVKNKDDLDLIRISDRKVIQTLPYGQSGASFTGLYHSSDGRRVYLSDADKRICIAGLDNNKVLKWEAPIILPAPAIGDSPVPGGVAMNDKGDKLYVTLSRNNSLAVVDLSDNSVTQIDVGIAPFGVIYSSSNKAYVSNWGGRRPEKGESAYNSSGSRVLVDQKTGIANNGSVSVVGLKKKLQVKNIEVGLHPSGMVLSPDGMKLYVACANSDIISVIGTDTDAIIDTISVHKNKNILFGSSPNELAISPDGHFLYAACGTENAVCVIQTDIPAKIMGYIPTGWYPGSLVLNTTGDTLYVANVKGVGSRNLALDRNGYNSHDHLGSVSVIPLPGKAELEKMTETVTMNNSWAKSKVSSESSAGSPGNDPVPVIPGRISPIKHVVYIIKENRTYDQVFGDMSQGNGDTSLVHFGREVTPNHHKLAEEFVLLDNFYCSGVLSADGHQWTDEAFVTDYIEKSFGDFTRSYPYDGDDALAYASSGFIWDNVLKHGLTFRDYGEFVNAVIDPPDATFAETYKDFMERTKKITIRATANLEQLIPNMCQTYIGFPNTVSDQYRASEFIRELKEFEQNDRFPNFIIMLLPADHTSGTRPGMPAPKAAVADNDLALGKIVQAISESKFWKETCILVTEDDPQDGLDHVDGHRTVGLVISPYTRRGEVVSTYYSQINMVRTIENILGLPPMNQLDMSAEPMVDCFTSKPDFSPYKAIKNNIPLDQLNPPLVSLSGDQLYWAEKSMEQDLGDVDRIDEDVFNRAIWHSVKGYDRPYPVLKKRHQF